MQNHMNHNFHIFLDIDGVLATTAQFYSKKRHEEWNCYRFDHKCVKIFNIILDRIKDPIVILSSDWKLHYDLETLNKIFKWNGVNCEVTATTSDYWGNGKFKSLDQIEECRADEINTFVTDNDIKHWLAIDDLDLSPWIKESNFVRTPRESEGIKQSGIRDKILKRIL